MEAALEPRRCDDFVRVSADASHFGEADIVNLRRRQGRSRLPAHVKRICGAAIRQRRGCNGLAARRHVSLHDYVAQTYVPACRESIAATSLPNGGAAYAFHVRWQTTTTLTPAQIHDVGLPEVRRIRADTDKVIASTGFKGSFHDFTEFLRTDSRFFYDKPDDLVDGYRIIAKKIDPELAHVFGKLPRLPYGVCVIPDFKAPSETTAYYQAGA